MSKRVYKNIFYGLLLWGTGVPSFLACQVSNKGESAHMSKLLEATRVMDVRIDLYGKVIDQESYPIKDANVLLHLTKFSPNPKSFFRTVIDLHVKTDAQGCFTVLKEMGSQIGIEDVNKKGYEYSRKQNPTTSFNFDQSVSREYSPDPHPLISDPKHPFVLHVRKMGESTFLLEKKDGGGFTFNKEESGTQKGYDFIEDIRIKNKDIKESMFNGSPLVCDIKAQAMLDAKSGDWTMILSTGEVGGGIFVSDKLLYEAPAESYQAMYILHSAIFKKKYIMNLNERGIDNKGKPINGIYLYVRSRNPSIYSRIRISTFEANNKEITLGGDGWITNPYGDRNLEQATDLPWEVSAQLRNEVRESYRLNKRPPKPDLQRLIQKAENKKPLLQRLFK